MEPIELRAISPGKSFTPVSIQVLDVDGGGLRMRFTGGEWQHFSEPNLFKCLMSLRTYLEKQELLLCCQGARPDVFPSGMQQQMEVVVSPQSFPAFQTGKKLSTYSPQPNRLKWLLSRVSELPYTGSLTCLPPARAQNNPRSNRKARTHRAAERTGGSLILCNEF